MLQLLKELVSHATLVHMLVNPNNSSMEIQTREAQAAARVLGLDLQIVTARARTRSMAPFRPFSGQKAATLMVASDPFFTSRRESDRRSGGSICGARDLSVARVRDGRRPDKLRRQQRRRISPARCLCRADSQGRKPPTCRSSSRRTLNWSSISRPRSRSALSAGTAACPRRRGDRMMTRREFITLLGGAAAAWPVAARAQQPAMPVIGFLSGASPWAFAHRRGCVPPGPCAKPAMSRAATSRSNIAGRRVDTTDCRRWRRSRPPRCAVIAATGGSPRASPPRRRRRSIPIVFAIGGDPVKLGLVASLNRPGGNITGATFFASALGPKRLELLRDLVPKATRSPAREPGQSECRVRHAKRCEAAARSLGLRDHVLNASSEREFDAAFATLAEQRRRRPLRACRCLLLRPARSTRRIGDAPRGARDL